MTKRWKVSFDGGATYDTIVNPLKAARFSRTRDLKAGQIFRRRRLNEKLEFGDDDYHLFYAWERTSVRRCNRLYVRQYRLCAGQWKVFWTGRFSAGAGSWDHDACRFEVKPEVEDRYSCILDHIDDKVNILGAEAVEVEASIMPVNIVFETCIAIAPDIPEDVCDPLFPPAEGWLDVGTLALPAPYPPGSSLRVYAREQVTLQCVDGASFPPVGTGWVLVEDNCATDSTAIYARIPDTGPWGLFGPDFGTCPNTVPAPATIPWFLIRPCDSTTPPVFFFIQGTEVTYERARMVADGLRLLLDAADCGVEGIVSDFFEWDPPGDAPGYVVGSNYVTGQTNQLDNLFFLQKSDAIDPTSSNPATRLDMTLGEMFEIFRKAFNVFWDIDEDGRLRFEHWRYYVAVEDLDLTVGESEVLNRGRNRYDHLVLEIPKYERFVMAEANGVDFVGKDIVYDSPCVLTEDREKVEETRLGNVTTDVAMINSTPDAISKSGMVLLATRDDGTGFQVIQDTGALSGAPATNAPLSWANLHRDYFTWNRYLKQGNMNGQDVIFDGILPNIQQPDMRLKFCCGMEEWDGTGTVKTELGEKYLNGRQGFVERDELDDSTDMVKLTLRYAY